MAPATQSFRPGSCNMSGGQSGTFPGHRAGAGRPGDLPQGPGSSAQVCRRGGGPCLGEEDTRAWLEQEVPECHRN